MSKQSLPVLVEQLRQLQEPVEIVGAENYYNARGRGYTMTRRVLRDVVWQWVSRPASRGRYYARDRQDVQWGEVWPGEVIAEFRLGESTPRAWYVVHPREARKLLRLSGVRLRDGSYRLTHEEYEGEIIVTDPYWK